MTRTEDQPQVVIRQEEDDSMHPYATSLANMIKRVESEPKPKLLYSGIKEKSVGTVFGPAKAGKTMYCENLGMSIAAGANSYLGLPISIENKRSLFVSMEEHYSYRTDRNSKQVGRLVKKYGEAWLDNYVVVNERLPQYINTEDDWQYLADLLMAIDPGIAFFDSLTRMYKGSIEDSKVAIELMKKLRWLSETTNAAIVAIHHTHKMYGQRLSIDTIAGSRVVAQESDFMIGLNRTPDGQKYIKEVAFRYARTNDDTVCTYNICDDGWLEPTGQADEGKLLAALDGRKDDGNKALILDFMAQQKEAGVTIVSLNDIVEKFVSDDPTSSRNVMTRTTVFNNLNKLLEENSIVRFGRGAYSLVE